MGTTFAKSLILKLLLTWAMYLVIVILFGSFIYIMIHPEIVTLTFTNVGFAVFIAFANTCFSWARTFSESHQIQLSKRINTVAYFCIVCALTFIVSSFCQFVLSTLIVAIEFSIVFKAIYWILYVLRGLTLFGVFILATGILSETFAIIRHLVFYYVPRYPENLREKLGDPV